MCVFKEVKFLFKCKIRKGFRVISIVDEFGLILSKWRSNLVKRDILLLMRKDIK